MPRNSFIVDVATPRKVPSSVIANGLDCAIALVNAAMSTTQVIATLHTGRDGRYRGINFPVKIMTGSFRGSRRFRTAGNRQALAPAGGSGANYSSAEVAGESSKLELKTITSVYVEPLTNLRSARRESNKPW